MKKIGTLQPRLSRQIVDSRIGVGFECLDRRMWDDTDALYDRVGALGVKHARVQTGWCRCEVEPGRFDFAWLDRIVGNLLERGVQPWFNLGYGNILYSDAQHPDAVGWAPIHGPEQRAAWLRYVVALVEHFRGRVVHYEIWNEPDIDSFWVGGSDPHAYMELVRLTAPAIRERDPGAKIVGGAIGRGLTHRGLAFLDACLREGLAEFIDAFSYHRYFVFPERQRPEDIEALRAAFRAHGGAHIELWQGESGCPSVPSTTHALAHTPVSEVAQAAVLLRSIVSDLVNGLDYTCYFHVSDFRCYYRNGHCAVPNYFGLLTCDDPPRAKPSYFAFQSLCALFDAETTRDPRGSVELWLAGMEDTARKHALQDWAVQAKTGSFVRGGLPLAVWWFPGNPLGDAPGASGFDSSTTQVAVWSPVGAMCDPVVVDPLSGEVFEPAHEAMPMPPGSTPGIRLLGVPLKRTPMIAVDRCAIEILASGAAATPKERKGE